jgi:hypothetical protein
MERRVPFQVMLEPEQHHQLRRVAEQRGQSIGSLVRESVARYLADVAVEDDPLMGFIGLADDTGDRPHGDVATEHDAYIADRAPRPTATPVARRRAPNAKRSPGRS